MASLHPKSTHVRAGARAKRERQERAWERGGTLPKKQEKYT